MIGALILTILITCIFTLLDDDFTIRKLLIRLNVSLLLFLLYSLLVMMVVEVIK